MKNRVKKLALFVSLVYDWFWHEAGSAALRGWSQSSSATFSVNTTSCKLHPLREMSPMRLRRVVLAQVGHRMLLLVSLDQSY